MFHVSELIAATNPNEQKLSMTCSRPHKSVIIGGQHFRERCSCLSRVIMSGIIARERTIRPGWLAR